MAEENFNKPSENLSRLGGFELLEKIGQGGMGTVYRARQTSLDRVVALKVLTAQLASDAKYIDSFLREAKSAARLNHPNIVSVIDAGEAEGTYFYVMEFVRGETLQRWVSRDGALPENTALGIGLCVANALKHAWDKEHLIHRDVKPENVMVDADGNVKLCDLGLAKNFGETTLMSLSGQVFGTPQFMSPEQARADREVDCRSDIYSLGMTLYFAFTGHIPFHAGTPTLVMARHLTEQLVDPREFAPQLSSHVCRILEKMLAKEVAERYQTWEQALRDIELALHGKAPSLPPTFEGKSSMRRELTKGVRGTSPQMSQKPPPAAKRPAAVMVTRAAPSSQPKSKSALGFAALILVILMLGAFVLFKQQKQPTTDDTSDLTETPNRVPPTQPAPPPQPVTRESSKQWNDVRVFVTQNPGALDEIEKRTRQFLANFPNSNEAANAKQLLASLPPSSKPTGNATPAVQLQTPEMPEPLAPIEVSEEEHFVAAQGFTAFSKQYLDALSRRDFEAAEGLAQIAAQQMALQPVRESLVNAGNAAVRLNKFWAGFPFDLQKLKGTRITVSNVTGTLSGVTNVELQIRIPSLFGPLGGLPGLGGMGGMGEQPPQPGMPQDAMDEILKQFMQGQPGAQPGGQQDAPQPVAPPQSFTIRVMPIAKITTADAIKLMEKIYVPENANAMHDVAWFAFAGKKYEDVDKFLQTAQQNGANTTVTVETISTLLHAADEETAAKTVLEIRAAIKNNAWEDARTRVESLKTTYAQSRTVARLGDELQTLDQQIQREAGAWRAQQENLKGKVEAERKLVAKADADAQPFRQSYDFDKALAIYTPLETACTSEEGRALVGVRLFSTAQLIAYKKQLASDINKTPYTKNDLKSRQDIPFTGNLTAAEEDKLLFAVRIGENTAERAVTWNDLSPDAMARLGEHYLAAAPPQTPPAELASRHLSLAVFYKTYERLDAASAHARQAAQLQPALQTETAAAFFGPLLLEPREQQALKVLNELRQFRAADNWVETRRRWLQLIAPPFSQTEIARNAANEIAQIGRDANAVFQKRYNEAMARAKSKREASPPKWGEVEQACRDALEVAPGDGNASALLVTAQYEQAIAKGKNAEYGSKWTDARYWFKQALEYKPDSTYAKEHAEKAQRMLDHISNSTSSSPPPPPPGPFKKSDLPGW